MTAVKQQDGGGGEGAANELKSPFAGRNGTLSRKSLASGDSRGKSKEKYYVAEEYDS